MTVDDADAPRGAVGGIVTPASGTVTLSVRATDAGVGLARAEATVDGVVVAAAPLGGSGCTDLSPGDAAVDLPLGGGCPAAVTDLQLPIPTPTITDGAHRLRVTVTDAAGNAAVLADQDFTINNTPPDRQSTAMLTLGTAGTTPRAAARGAGGGAARRWRRLRRGRLRDGRRARGLRVAAPLGVPEGQAPARRPGACRSCAATGATASRHADLRGARAPRQGAVRDRRVAVQHARRQDLPQERRRDAGRRGADGDPRLPERARRRVPLHVGAGPDPDRGRDRREARRAR